MRVGKNIYKVIGLFLAKLTRVLITNELDLKKLTKN